jgi:pyruvate dehydrogenase E2 component (dihydrolipoamide acetyltransferase)
VKVGAPLLAFEEGVHPETGTVVGELAKPVPSQSHAVAAPRAGSQVVRATPSVRARAKELGVDLFRVTGSGPQGAITRPDVEAAAKTPAESSAALRGARKTMASNMSHAWREVAHATLQDTVDIEAWPPHENVTVRLIRAIVAGCAAEPSLNARFDGASLSMRRNPQIDLGLAIDSPDGLFVPVLRDVGRTSAPEWRRQIDTAKQGVGDRSLAPSELRGATITLSNFGAIAGRHAALIVVPPQVAILGAGRIASQAMRSGDGVSWHRMLPLSLTFDHRAVTGGEAARFLRAAMVDLEKSA